MNIQLDELEILGLRIVCASRCGLLGALSCMSGADDAGSVGECSDCESVYIPELDIEFDSCPMAFISQSVYSFLNRYDTYEKYPNSIQQYEKMNPRYFEAVRKYESYMAEFRQGATPNSNTDSNLAKLRSLKK